MARSTVDLRDLGPLEHEEVERPWVASAPPSRLVVPGREHRPIRVLRELAGDPLAALRRAAALWESDREAAAAMAEMAVTGRASRAAFERLGVRSGDIGRGPSATDAIAHAHRVLSYLDGSPDERRRRAPALAHDKGLTLADGEDAPWLAVAAELDAPHRPVNVGVTRHAQQEADVVVMGRSRVVVRARYVTVGDLRSDRGVVLLLHGLGSRLEEVDVVASELASRGLGVIAVDLPSQGYSSRVAPERIGDPAAGTYAAPAWDRDDGYSYLAFAESFALSLVDTLGVSERLVAVAGGSLGGTLALRIAIHGGLGHAVSSIAWSPGSVWGTQQTNYVNWAAIEATAGRRLFRGEVMADDHDADDAHDSRTDYIRWIFEAPAPLMKAQPTLWFKGMKLEREHTLASRADRRELYDHAHRVTCLALAYEQTIYSITETPRGHSAPRYARIGTPVLVMAGARDDDMLDIHREVGKLAGRLGQHGRRGRIVRLDACHSIHDERPRALAAEIDAFLRERDALAAGHE